MSQVGHTIVAVVGFSVLGLFALALLWSFVAPLLPKGSPERQEARLERVFGRGRDEVRWSADAYTLPAERIDEIAARHGYRYAGEYHTKTNTYVQYRLKELFPEG